MTFTDEPDELIAAAVQAALDIPNRKRVGDPALCRRYKIKLEGDRFWKATWKGHPILFRKEFIFDAEHDRAGNWRDAIDFFESPNGYHWTAVTTEFPDCWVGDKRKQLPRDCRSWRVDYHPTRAHLQRLYDSPLVGYDCIYHTASEEIRVAFPQHLHAMAELNLHEAFDGWRYSYHINRWFHPPSGYDGKKSIYDNAASGAPIYEPPFPTRAAAIDDFFAFALRFYVDPKKETNPANLEALRTALETACQK